MASLRPLMRVCVRPAAVRVSSVCAVSPNVRPVAVPSVAPAASSWLQQRCFSPLSVVARPVECKVPFGVPSMMRSFHSSVAAAKPDAATATAKQPDMFCYQCEQTRNGTGCRTIGVCGKSPDVAALQDLIIHEVLGVCQYVEAAKAAGAAPDREIQRFVLEALFATVTNVNFDAEACATYARKAAAIKIKAKQQYEDAAGSGAPALSGHAAYEMPLTADTAALVKEGQKFGVWAKKNNLGDDYTGIQEMTLYGIKGTAAYAHHALEAGQEKDSVYDEIITELAALTKTDNSVDTLLGNALAVGKINLDVMEMLDSAHTQLLGTPAPKEVPLRPKVGKSILISGHDLVDLKALLEQTEGTGINVYTHGEMLPAHGYPELNKYPHLAGHYGGPWQLQKFEFSEFPGPIIMTSNCIIEPRRTYKDRIFTRAMVGWPGVSHLDGRDFSSVIAAAKEEDGFEEDDLDTYPNRTVTTGFGHGAVLGIADTVVGAIKGGDIKHFFLIGGCDGAEGKRSYYTEFAQKTPKDTMILTLGCGKYRFNNLDLGTIGGLPRVLDMGQCNDAYSAIKVAGALAEVFECSVNELPLSMVVSWFEQKAVAVLLTLLHLGIRNIRIGPELPGFATPAMLQILQEKYALEPITDVKQQMDAMLSGH